MAVFLIYIISVVVCVPNFVTINIKNHTEDEKYEHKRWDVESNGSNRPLYVQYHQVLVTEPVNDSTLIWTVRFKTENEMDRFLYSFNFWIQALLVKFVPCVGLTFLSIALVRTMRRADARHQTMRLANIPHSSRQGTRVQGVIHKSSDSDVPSVSDALRSRYVYHRYKRHEKRTLNTNRTTKMLLIVVILFIITEFPHGIVNLVSGLKCENFVDEIYMNLGDLLDILALINNGINFVLYCTMSKQFRERFATLFAPSTTFAAVTVVVVKVVHWRR